METMIVLQSGADKQKFRVEEAVAMQFESVREHLITIKHENLIDPTYRFNGVTEKILSKVIDYCKNHVDYGDDIEFVKQLDHPVTLFNFIQAAHELKVKSLMDLTCRTLVNKFKSKTYGEIMIGGCMR